jgi:hypothetical protein
LGSVGTAAAAATAGMIADGNAAVSTVVVGDSEAVARAASLDDGVVSVVFVEDAFHTTTTFLFYLRK